MSETLYYILLVPAIFFEDHLARCPFEGASKILGSKGRNVKVQLDEIDLADLYSDASHYSSFDGYDFSDNRSVCLSAKATVRSLAKQLTADQLKGARGRARAKQDAIEAAQAQAYLAQQLAAAGPVRRKPTSAPVHTSGAFEVFAVGDVKLNGGGQHQVWYGDRFVVEADSIWGAQMKADWLDRAGVK